MNEQQCSKCTWDGVKLVKMCAIHQRIDDLETKLATAETERATDRINLAAWVIRNLNQFGCFTGDCPHWEESECIQAIVNNYKEEAAKAAGGCDGIRP